MRRLMMPRKKLLRGSIHRVPIIPVKTRPSTIKNPQGSNLPRAMDWRAGKRPAKILPPSRGGSGNRLNTSKPIFHITPAFAIEVRKGSSIPKPCTRTQKTAQMIACTKFDPGPAKATQIESILGFLSRPKLTGTGLAYPTKKGDPVRIKTSGINRVPTGSICLAGLRLTRPSM